MEKAGNILRDLFNDLKLPSKNAEITQAGSVFGNWETLAGREISEKSKIKEIEHRTLVVEVEHSGISQLIMMRKTEILRKIKRRYPSLEISSIRTISGQGKEEQVRKTPQKIDKKGEKRRIAEKKNVKTDEILETIEDTKLKAALKRLQHGLEQDSK